MRSLQPQTMKKLIIIAGLFLTFFAGKVHATTITQPDYSNSIPIRANNTYLSISFILTQTSTINDIYLLGDSFSSGFENGSWHIYNSGGNQTMHDFGGSVGIQCDAGALSGILNFPNISTSTFSGTTALHLNSTSTNLISPGCYYIYAVGNNFTNVSSTIRASSVPVTSITSQFGRTNEYQNNIGTWINNSYPMYFSINATPSLPGSHIEFRYPTSTTQLFSNWLLKAENLNATGSYEAQVKWTATLPDGTVTPLLQNRIGNLNFQYPDWYPVIPRTDWSFNFATDVTINAEADLLSSQDPNNPGVDLAFPTVIASTTESFTLLSIPNGSPSSTLPDGGIVVITNQDASGTITITSTTGNQYLNFNASTSGATFNISCAPPSNILDVGGGIAYGGCQILNFLFNPNVLYNSTGYFTQQIKNIEAVPPFSPFFNLANSANTTLGLISSSSASSSAGVNITIKGFDNENVTLLRLNSTTFYAGFGNAPSSTTTDSHNTMDFLTHYITAWLWIGAGIKLLAIFTMA